MQIVSQIKSNSDYNIDRNNSCIRFKNSDGTACEIQVTKYDNAHPLGFDFSYAEKISQFMQTSNKQKENDSVRGGLNFEPEINTKFGMRIEQSTDEEIAQFVNKFDKQIKCSESTRINLQEVIKDKKILQSFELFFQDGGILEQGHTGIYKPKSLQIIVGGKELEKLFGAADPISEQITLIHEVMHYLGDKANNRSTTESKPESDHYFIYPATNKIQILSDFLAGREPNPINIDSKEGLALYKKINELSKKDNLDELQAFVSSKEFYLEQVISQIKSASIALPSIWVDQKSRADFLNDRPGFHLLNQKEQQELNHLYAQQAVLTSAGYQIAISVAKKNNLELQDAFKTTEFKNKLTNFVKNVFSDSNDSLFQKAKSALEKEIN